MKKDLNKLDENVATVLVIDDDELTRGFIVTQASHLGVNILEAKDGREALEILRTRTIDVVVTDLVMPNMSGMMLLHTLLEEGRFIPFIFITGYGDKESAIQALRLGAFDFLEKPVDVNDLNSILTEALRIAKEQKSSQPGSQSDGRRGLEEIGSYLPIQQGKENEWRKARDQFIDEAIPQIVFCESSLTTLPSKENIRWEIGFLARSIQTIRKSAEAIGINSVASFAWAIEALLSAIRADSEALNSEHIKILRESVALLRQKVNALGDIQSKNLQERLLECANQILEKKDHKKSVS